MLVGLANINGIASIKCNFIYHMGFQILIKSLFQFAKKWQDFDKKFLIFFVVKMIRISHSFLVYLQYLEYCFLCIEQEQKTSA